MTSAKQKITNKKIVLLTKIKNGILTMQELSRLRKQKKDDWCDKYLDSLLIKYNNLPPEEQAFNIIYLEHLNLNPNDIHVKKISVNKFNIHSRNFCPYLEACLNLGLDTRLICKETGEYPFQRLAERVHPQLRFTRNYENIRPYSDFCEEYIEFIH